MPYTADDLIRDLETLKQFGFSASERAAIQGLFISLEFFHGYSAKSGKRMEEISGSDIIEEFRQSKRV